ncbi:hypothetical protein SRRS_18780 [Sporomusa rhizae]|uniref:hypothetical protein n=1 Tax=Sporomusa rhizae TaxID=357999 RepID=UPI00352AE3F3
MRKLIKLITYMIVSLFIFVMSLFIFIPLLNDYRLFAFAQQLKTLPQNITLVESKTICGKLNGNGNGMDFLACILVKSDLSLEEIQQYYDGIVFQTAKNDVNHKVEKQVLPVKGNKLETEYLEHGSISFDTLKPSPDYSKYYIMLIYDGGYSADLDIRGH